MWRETNDWKLQWKKGQAKQRRVLHLVQTRRLLLGDAASYEGDCGKRARTVECKCGHGICSSEHWMFDCCLPIAREQRERVAVRVEEVGDVLAKGEGGRQHSATATTLGVLRGQGEAGADERLVAMRWLIGSIPEPAGAGRGARLAAGRALTASADSWQVAATYYTETREQFLLDEKMRARACGFIDKLRRLIVLRGPSAEPAPSASQRAAVVDAIREGKTAGVALDKHHTWRQVLDAIEGRQARRLGRVEDRLRSAAEWGAAVVLAHALYRWRHRRGRVGEHSADGARVGYRRWGAAVSRCPDLSVERAKELRTAARLAREARRRNEKRQAAHFAMIMGVEGDGNITLAPGLEDVNVNFSKRHRTNWKTTGRRRSRRRKPGTRGTRGPRAGDDDGELCDDESETSESEVGSGAEGSDDEWGFESADGEDGNGGIGGAEGLVVGDLLRIWWDQEEVWFRCRVVGLGDGGRVAKVSYLVDDRWGCYVHVLEDVTWETWTEGGEVDEREASYNLDEWIEPVDREAAAAAEASRDRRAAGGAASARGEHGDGASIEEHTLTDEAGGDERGGGSGRSRSRAAGAGTGATGSAAKGRFAWVVRAVPRGSGMKKRKLLLEALVDEWEKGVQESDECRPAADKMTIYRVMRKVMAVKLVASELKVLERAGLVVISGDEVRCGMEQTGDVEGVGGATEATTGVNVDDGNVDDEGKGSGTTGERRRPKRSRRGSARRAAETDDSETGETGGDADSVGRDRGTRRRRRVASYAESDQESEEGGAEGWD
jgi:hypothetical protein